MAESTIQGYRPWAAGAAVIGAVMLAIYVVLILSEEGSTVSSILPWALLMASAPAMALGSVLMGDRRQSRSLMIGAAVLFGLLGVVSILTIGLGFLVAAALATVGIVKLGTT